MNSLPKFLLIITVIFLEKVRLHMKRDEGWWAGLAMKLAPANDLPELNRALHCSLHKWH